MLPRRNVVTWKNFTKSKDWFILQESCKKYIFGELGIPFDFPILKIRIISKVFQFLLSFSPGFGFLFLSGVLPQLLGDPSRVCLLPPFQLRMPSMLEQHLRWNFEIFKIVRSQIDVARKFLLLQLTILSKSLCPFRKFGPK